VGVEIPVRPTAEPRSAPGKLPAAASASGLSLASAAQQMLLDRFAPACVMIDRKLQVLYVHGAVEDYLTFPAGELTTRIVDMAREGLRARLRGAIAKLFRDEQDIRAVLKWKEIYDDLETAIDRCEDVANIVEGIVIEMA
jgi:hypothetical protein